MTQFALANSCSSNVGKEFPSKRAILFVDAKSVKDLLFVTGLGLVYRRKRKDVISEGL